MQQVKKKASNIELSEISAARGRARLALFLVGVLLLITIAFFFFNKRAAVCIGIIACLLRIILVRCLNTKYQRMFQKYSSLLGIGSYLDSPHYVFKSKPSVDQLVRFNIVPEGLPCSSSVNRHLIKGKYYSNNIEIVEISNNYRLQNKNIAFINGMYVKITGPFVFDSSLVLIGKECQDELFSVSQYEALGYNRAYFSKSDLNEQYYAFNKSSEKTESVPADIEAYWAGLVKRFGQKAVLSLTEDEIFIFLRKTFYVRECSLANAPTEDDLRVSRTPDSEYLLKAYTLFK